MAKKTHSGSGNRVLATITLLTGLVVFLIVSCNQNLIPEATKTPTPETPTSTPPPQHTPIPVRDFTIPGVILAGNVNYTAGLHDAQSNPTQQLDESIPGYPAGIKGRVDYFFDALSGYPSTGPNYVTITTVLPSGWTTNIVDGAPVGPDGVSMYLVVDANNVNIGADFASTATDNDLWFTLYQPIIDAYKAYYKSRGIEDQTVDARDDPWFVNLLKTIKNVSKLQTRKPRPGTEEYLATRKEFRKQHEAIQKENCLVI